jgi:GTP-binding protein HflX
MTKKAQSHSAYRPKVLLAGIHAPYNHTPDINAYFEEFVNLVKSNNIKFDEIIFFKLRDIDPGTFIQKGKLEQLLELCEKHDIDEVILSEPISPQQERNLRDFLHRKVFDRTQLILEIFEKSAHSAEGKTQVQIAMLQHKKSRLSGRGVHLAQQSGAAGTMAGAGETAKERERRHIEDEIIKLKKQLERIHQTRETQRKQRLTHDVPLICLIGYTNAGKSTILNALTKSDVLAEDRLFATLDTTTRQLFIAGKKKGVISDTVGFIQLLPPKLIEAFKSTLMELQYADLLLHVVDVSDPNWENHIHVVEQILDDLNVEKPILYVLNKADKINVTPTLEQSLEKYMPHVLISAKHKENIAPLTDYIENWKA